MKRIALFFDGTWKKADAPGDKNTNVARLMRAVRCRDADGTPQIVFYDAGVGTGNFVDRFIGGVVGRGVNDNIQDGYRFLANNYEAGDEIYIFGYSRGAFTARSLGGLIKTIGILDKTEMEHVGEAWRLYRTPKARRSPKLLEKLRGLAVTGVKIKCIGVWDTVGSLGIPGDFFLTWNRRKYRFHDTALGDHVEYAFHAMGLDEKRGPFAPTLWTAAKGDNARMGVEQVWFAGVHSNIGGGGPHEGLSNITLRWMADRIAANTALALDETYLCKRCAPNERAHLDTITDNLKLLYTFSRLVPFQRLIGYESRKDVGLWSRLFRRYSRPDAKSPVALNEMIHWSAQRRHAEADRSAPYRPHTLVRAFQGGSLPVCTLADQRTPCGGSKPMSLAAE